MTIETLNKEALQYLGLDNEEEYGQVMEWKSDITMKSNDDDNEIIFDGVGSNSSKDLYNEAMHPKFINKMIKQINGVVRKKGFFPQFSNHDFDWQNMIGKIFKAWNDKGNLRYNSNPILANPLANQLIGMLKENAPIENSIVVCRVQWKEMEHPETKEKMDMIVDGVIKSIDFVGLGANEQTNVGIAKSLKGKDFRLIGENMPEPTDMELNLQEDNPEAEPQTSGKDAGVQTPDVLEERIKTLEEKMKTFSDDTVKNLKVAAETALKEILSSMKSQFETEVSTKVEQKVAEILEDRKQKALAKKDLETNTDESREKDLIAMIESGELSEKAVENLMATSLKLASTKGDNVDTE